MNEIEEDYIRRMSEKEKDIKLFEANYNNANKEYRELESENN